MKDESNLASITLRTTLLEQAVGLCSSLNTVLEKIGSSRFIKSLAAEFPNSLGDGGNSLRQLARLEDQLQRRLQSINEHRNHILSPIFRLPDDVLRHIFTLSVPYRSFETPPWVVCLAEVCRQWRAVARDTGIIWAFLCLSSYDPGMPASHFLGRGAHNFLHPWYDTTRVELLECAQEAYFALSKAALLSVFKPSSHALDQSSVESFVAQCANRVKHLKIAAAQNERFDLLSTCILATRLSLQRLEIVVFTLDGAQIQAFADDLFKTCMPCLIELELKGVPLPTDLESPYLLFDSCKRISLAPNGRVDVLPEHFAPFLGACRNVRDLSLQLFNSAVAVSPAWMPPSRPQSRVPMLDLKSLELWSSRWIASSIYAPNLTDLQLSGEAHTSSPYDLTEVHEFLKVSAPALSSLNVVGLDAASVTTLLQMSRSLKDQTYYAHDNPPDDYLILLDAMTNDIDVSGACLGPSLERVAFPGWAVHPTDPVYEKLWSLVDYRHRNMNSFVQIRRLELCSARRMVPPGEGRVLEERLADAVEEFIVRQGNWERALQWKFDKVARRWKRHELGSNWD